MSDTATGENGFSGVIKRPGSGKNSPEPGRRTEKKRTNPFFQDLTLVM